MKKKLTAIALIALIAFSFASCDPDPACLSSQEQPETTESKTPSYTAPSQNDEGDAPSIIVIPEQDEAKTPAPAQEEEPVIETQSPSENTEAATPIEDIADSTETDEDILVIRPSGPVTGF